VSSQPPEQAGATGATEAVGVTGIQDRPTEPLPQSAPAAMLQRLRGMLVALLGATGMLLAMLLCMAFGLFQLPAYRPTIVPTRELLLDPQAQAAAAPTSVLLLGGEQVLSATAVPTLPPLPVPPPGSPPAIAERFRPFYENRGGLRLFGLPISEPMIVNGREVQWFERARFEFWPEFSGTPYEIQLGLLGSEYTAGRQFARQSFFVSRPDLRFFPETGHSLGGRFLQFWEQNGALDIFGLPVSEEFDEVFPDGLAYRVQYFERARLEYHPEAAMTPYEIQIGLLGRALHYNEARPTTVQPVPTAVPLP
jgi:hypothetical protein